MPRKKNGIPYEVYRSPMKGEDGQNIVYVRPQSRSKVDMDELDAYCAQNYAVHRGETTRLFNVFMQAVSSYLADGYTIETPIGTFAPKIGLQRTITNPDEVKNQDVCFEGIAFRSSKLFDERVERWTNGFCRVYNADTQELMADTKRLESVLQHCLADNGYVTVGLFAKKTGLTKYSARKQMDAWCQGDLPRLLKTKMARQFIYTSI